MLGRLNHVAIAVADLDAAAAAYRQALDARVSEPVELAAHGVRLAFIELPNTRIELIEPLGPESPISHFLAKHPQGGLHHVCYEVDDLAAASRRLRAEGARALGSGEPRIGADGHPVLFLHPKDFSGTLIELVEVKEAR